MEAVANIDNEPPRELRRVFTELNKQVETDLTSAKLNHAA